MPASIRMEPNGPYIVTGPITIADADGNVIHDETHRRVDFVSRPSFLPEPAERS